MGMMSVSSMRLLPVGAVGDEPRLEAILIVSPDHVRREELADVIEGANWHAASAASAQAAMWELSPVLPHLVADRRPRPTDSDGPSI